MNQQGYEVTMPARTARVGRSVSGLSAAPGFAARLVAALRRTRAQREDVEAIDAMRDMNEYMLKDIGAPAWLVSSVAARRQFGEHRADRLAVVPWTIAAVVQLSVTLLAAALLTGTTASAGQPTGAAVTNDASTQEQMVAVFSGTYINGTPVYRLPRMTVVAPRPTELARNERPAQPVAGGEARARAVAKPAT
jgi:hypothetical protein